MQLGVIANPIRRVAPVWSAGPFQWTIFGSLRRRRGVSFYVQTMRCTQCGYLESYAK